MISKSWIKAHSKWLGWLLLSVLIGVVYIVFRFLFPGRKPVSVTDTVPAEPESGIPMLPSSVQNKLDQAHEEAAVARATASAKAEDQKAQLTQIQQIQDDKERRRRLAEMLRTL